LYQKQQELLNKVKEIKEDKKKELKLQAEELKFGIRSIIGSRKNIEEKTAYPFVENVVRIMKNKELYKLRLNYLSTNIWRVEPCHNSFIGFISLKNEEESIYSSISKIGMINLNDISAKKCLILRDEKERIYKDKEFKFVIISYSKDGNEIRNGGNGMKFGIEIAQESKSKSNNGNNKKAEWKIIDLKNGRYEVIMKLKDEGKYLIFVQYDGININYPPFKIILDKNRVSFPNNLDLKKRFKYQSPLYGVTINSKGNILVSDSENNRIQVLNLEGNFISTFKSETNGNDQFNLPCGITINSKGNILVCDVGNNRIQIFDLKGNFISKFGSYGNGNGQFNGPSGICVDRYDNIFVSDQNNHRIQIFQSNGNFILEFGSEGEENGQLHYPSGIIINSKGNILISDKFNFRIQIFKPNGNFLSKFGTKGKKNGQFNYPNGICVDKNDNIFVSDFYNHRIQIFNSNGEYIKQFPVTFPRAITIHPQTQNIITCNNNSILIF